MKQKQKQQAVIPKYVPVNGYMSPGKGLGRAAGRHLRTFSGISIRCIFPISGCKKNSHGNPPTSSGMLEIKYGYDQLKLHRGHLHSAHPSSLLQPTLCHRIFSASLWAESGRNDIYSTYHFAEGSARGWGPAVPTEIRSSQLRSGAARGEGGSNSDNI